MDKSPEKYHISFFVPTTARAKANRNMVLWLVSIWFIAIFGFQILLRVLEKPIPETTFSIFQSVWDNTISDSPGIVELQEFGKTTLSVLGKVAITDSERAVLDNALSWSLYQLTADSLKEDLVIKIQAFEKIKLEIQTISDPNYIKAKELLSAEYSPSLNLDPLDVRTTILPLELVSENIYKLTETARESVPSIMEKYLIHNQSFLTDTKFLGFPFHYFYTAIFLLVLFIGLCLIYCIKTDQMNSKLSIED
ncbi:MAG: DUF4212 domain-containing protein [Bacteroidales bacterium]|nr:DUF4212 domain-containing protein [Bacteroidales bacterium]MCF8390812.1 DUF4212 domain-containing protein [Bacteroidales bacterium]